MNLTEMRAREQRRTQPAPVDLEHGRFEPDQVVRLWGIATTALAIGSFGGLLTTWGATAWQSSWGWLSGVGMWLVIFGVLLMVLSYAVALAITLLATRGWWQHQQRIEEWHQVYIDAYEAAGGQESSREVMHRTLTTTDPAHALLVALHVVQQAREGAQTPWSSTRLTGPLWYGGVRLGDLSKPEAEAFSRLLAEVGLVTGRKKGAAGQLAVATEGEVLQLVARNYGKYLPGRVERVEPEA